MRLTSFRCCDTRATEVVGAGTPWLKLPAISLASFRCAVVFGGSRWIGSIGLCELGCAGLGAAALSWSRLGRLCWCATAAIAITAAISTAVITVCRNGIRIYLRPITSFSLHGRHHTTPSTAVAVTTVAVAAAAHILIGHQKLRVVDVAQRALVLVALCPDRVEVATHRIHLRS